MSMDKRDRNGHLHCAMPKSLERAVREVARGLNTTPSALVRAALLRYLTHTVSPQLLAEAERTGRTDSKLRVLRLVDSIRMAVSDSSAPGRLRGQRVRACYMRYCRVQNRLGQPNLPYPTWRAAHDEIALTAPVRQAQA